MFFNLSYHKYFCVSPYHLNSLYISSALFDILYATCSPLFGSKSALIIIVLVIVVVVRYLVVVVVVVVKAAQAAQAAQAVPPNK